MPETKTTPIADSGNHGGIAMWPSEAIASRIYDVANMVLIAALVAGVIATALVVWMGNVKEGYLRTALATLNSQAAQANQRAADANDRATKAQLDLEKYKAPRVIAESQEPIFIDSVKDSAGQQYMLSVANGQEAASLVCAIDRLLKSAGWKRFEQPAPSIVIGTDCGPIGANATSDVHVRVALTRTTETTEAADRLLNALAAAGVTVHPGQDPVNVPNEHVVVIMVGTKL
jgi:hypothetical protein